MIGVVASEHERPWITELFELFKTPWEPFVQGRRYDAVLSTADVPADSVPVTIVYGATERAVDRTAAAPVSVQNGGTLDHDKASVVVYGSRAAFGNDRLACRWRWRDGQPGHYRVQTDSGVVHRVGYDLCREIRHLLVHGQPLEHAGEPTLERHIRLLRACLDAEGVPYLEVPPRPAGFEFICCLTHDIDFFGLRRHTADRTLLGFAARGTAGSVLDVWRGRRPVDEALGNIAAVLRAPFVLLGLARDPWQPFADYLHADGHRPSTFFLVPFARTPGVSPDGTVVGTRAVAYGARDIRDEVTSIDSKTELAVHGIDAWRDVSAGRRERDELSAVTGRSEHGVRMHWLYFSESAPRALEDAGFAYDSTCGYNDAVGYRAGTMQAFLLPGTRALLELPLTIMDTALFYPDRMGLSRSEALQRCQAILADARRFGGAVVVNWHDRSLAPERQWQRAYCALLDELDVAKPWFATARAAVDWFQWRRSIRFAWREDGTITVDGDRLPQGMPGARVVVHNGRGNESASQERHFDGQPLAMAV